MLAVVTLVATAVNALATHRQPTLDSKRIRSEEGWVKLTAYCPCPRCCGRYSDGIAKSGVRPAHRFTVAADVSVFPMGTILEVDGLGEVMVQDVGSAVRGLHLDVFHSTHEGALRFGVKRARYRVLHEPRSK